MYIDKNIYYHFKEFNSQNPDVVIFTSGCFFYNTTTVEHILVYAVQEVATYHRCCPGQIYIFVMMIAFYSLQIEIVIQ